MKMLTRFLSVIVFSIIVLSSCQKDKITTTSGSVVFKVQTDGVSNAKSTKAQDVSQAAAIIVSVEKAGGGVVYDKEKLELSHLNGSYLSKVLALKSGGYNLTEFLVVDANNQIIYATPKKGSKLENLVSKPLPIPFDCIADQESIIIPDVVKSDSSSLNDLGYVGFSFHDTHNILFLINVIALDSTTGTFEKVDSTHLFILNGLYYPVKTYDLTLRNTVNHIYLDNDGGVFILNVYKPGYTSWADTFTRAQLESYATTPIQVVLKPVKSICLNYMPDFNNDFYAVFEFSKRKISDLYVDEGYGSALKVNSNYYGHFETSYLVRCVQAWDNLDDIQSFSMRGNFNMRISLLESVDLRNAINLESFSAQYCQIPSLYLNNHSIKHVDFYFSYVSMSFTGCVNIETIKAESSPGYYDLQSSDKLQSLFITNGSTVIFGANPALSSVSLASQYSEISLAELNTLLVNLLKSVELAPRGGSFIAYNLFAGTTFPAPTDEGLVAAKKLRDVYNWNILNPL